MTKHLYIFSIEKGDLDTEPVSGPLTSDNEVNAFLEKAKPGTYFVLPTYVIEK